MQQGVVKFFIPDRGFGFIVPSDGSADVFVHIKALHGIRKLTEGQSVQYETGPGKDGKIKAVRVELVP